MPVTFRAATFNLENLFCRAKVLNLTDNQTITTRLNEIARLQKLLVKATYTPTDKTQILQLSKSLNDYITIREDRGKLFTGSGANRRVSAAGAKDWDGVIEFKKEKISKQAREGTADVVNALGAHVLCTVEVEDRLVLQDFNREMLGKDKFNYAMAIDGNDTRGIDVGLLTRFEIVNIRSHIYDRDAKGIVFSRDCLEIQLMLPDGRPLHILCNHLKSKGYGNQADNDEKRRRQAAQLARILSGFNLAQDLVIVAGDLNDLPGSAPLQPLLSLPNLHDALELQFGMNSQQRWTYKYRNQTNQIDFLLVSQPLRAGFVRAAVERRGIYGIVGQTPFPSVTSAKNAASDHGGVWAEFTV